MNKIWRCALFGALFLVAQAAGAAGVAAPGQADFTTERAVSAGAREVGDWIVRSGDNQGLSFAIVDKTDARVFVFDAGGSLLGAAPALVGFARGDDTVPGIGHRPISRILPQERTTAAGRFVASMERSLKGEQILWVDYDSGLAMHRVIAVAKERRLERLASPVAADRRITYGCINLPVKFFEAVLMPAFAGAKGIVYVLPETRSLAQAFAMQPR
jgi:hypothetical protein